MAKIDRGYVSEFTQFIDAELEAHPDWRRDQRRGWRIFWDKRVPHEELVEEALSHVSAGRLPVSASMRGSVPADLPNGPPLFSPILP